MEKHVRIVRPPQTDDVWYVKLHNAACTTELDTVLVKEMTPETVALVFIDEPAQLGALRTARYCTRDVVWIELVRVMPRVVEVPPCPIPSPSDHLAPLSEPRSPVRPLFSVPHLVPPPTQK